MFCELVYERFAKLLSIANLYAAVLRTTMSTVMRERVSIPCTRKSGEQKPRLPGKNKENLQPQSWMYFTATLS